MTKDELSDLRSLQARVVQAALEHARAATVCDRARHDLEMLLFRLEHPAKAAA